MASSTEVDIRDYLYTFAVPKGELGPWHVMKLDVDHSAKRSHLIARFVSGNRDDPEKPAHGEYARIEDTQTLSPCLNVLGGIGIGSGYQPMRTWTSEILARPNATLPVYVAVGMEFSTLTPTTYQRIIAVGPTFHFGEFFGYARYYRPSVPGQTFAVAPSGAFNLGFHVTRQLDVAGVLNVGGEIGGDRTASQLPTSSGRYGADIGTSVRYAITPRLGFTVLAERASYRQSPDGAFSRRQTVLSAGISMRSPEY